MRLFTRPRQRIERQTTPLARTDGRTVNVAFVRHPRATRITLSVDERGARLSLPLRASLVAGERFLHEHRDWLTTHVAAQAHHAGEGLCRDATTQLPLRGVELPLHWQAGRATRLDVDGDGLLFTAPASAGDAALQRFARDFDAVTAPEMSIMAEDSEFAIGTCATLDRLLTPTEN